MYENVYSEKNFLSLFLNLSRHRACSEGVLLRRIPLKLFKRAFLLDMNKI